MTDNSELLRIAEEEYQKNPAKSPGQETFKRRMALEAARKRLESPRQPEPSVEASWAPYASAAPELPPISAKADVERRLDECLSRPDVIRAVMAGELHFKCKPSGNSPGRCPRPDRHANRDRTASFGINPDKGGAWYCNKCGYGSNVTGCVMNMQDEPQIRFHEVKVELALKYGGFDYWAERDQAASSVDPELLDSEEVHTLTMKRLELLGVIGDQDPS